MRKGRQPEGVQGEGRKGVSVILHRKDPRQNMHCIRCLYVYCCFLPVVPADCTGVAGIVLLTARAGAFPAEKVIYLQQAMDPKLQSISNKPSRKRSPLPDAAHLHQPRTERLLQTTMLTQLDL